MKNLMMKNLIKILISLLFASVALADFSHIHQYKEGSKIIRYNGIKVAPKETILEKTGGSIYFLNQSNREMFVNVDFNEHRAHCSSAELSIQEDGTFLNKEGIESEDFVFICFPESGEYGVKTVSYTHLTLPTICSV